MVDDFGTDMTEEEPVDNLSKIRASLNLEPTQEEHQDPVTEEIYDFEAS